MAGSTSYAVLSAAGLSHFDQRPFELAGAKMLGTLKKWVADNLAGEAPPEMAGDDVELALAALLVELARADFRENPEEYAEIRQLLGTYLKSASRVESLLEAAAKRADRAVSLHEFTRQLNAELGEPEKFGVI